MVPSTAVGSVDGHFDVAGQHLPREHGNGSVRFVHDGSGAATDDPEGRGLSSDWHRTATCLAAERTILRPKRHVGKGPGVLGRSTRLIAGIGRWRRSPSSLHELASEVALSGKRVVRLAVQLEVVRHRLASERVGKLVMELEKARLATPLPTLIHERTPSPVAISHFTPGRCSPAPWLQHFDALARSVRTLFALR
jgi:hypothetical protein